MEQKLPFQHRAGTNKHSYLLTTTIITIINIIFHIENN